MREYKMKSRKTILVFGVFFAVFLMVSSATAVNTVGVVGNDQLLKDDGYSYNDSDQVLTDDMLSELREAIDQLKDENNPEFQKLTATLNERYSEGSEPTNIILTFLVLIFFFLLNNFPDIADIIIDAIASLIFLPVLILIAIIEFILY